MKFKLKEKVFFKNNPSKDNYGFIVGCELYSDNCFIGQNIKQRLESLTELKYYILVDRLRGTTIDTLYEHEILKCKELNDEI